LLKLQDKLNAYLRFLESGEIYERYPEASGRKLIINVVFMVDPNLEARSFLTRARTIVESAGFGFEFDLFAGRCRANVIPRRSIGAKDGAPIYLSLTPFAAIRVCPSPAGVDSISTSTASFRIRSFSTESLGARIFVLVSFVSAVLNPKVLDFIVETSKTGNE